MKQMELLREIKSVLPTISEKMSALEKELDSLSSYLQKKEWISEDLSSQVIGYLEDLNSLQIHCQSLYQELGFGMTMPDSLEHTDRLMDQAITELEQRQCLEKYSRFLALETDDPAVALLLNAKKDHLRELLDPITPEKESALEPYDMFIQAVAEPDYAKLVSYLIKLSPEFGNELLGEGILSKKIRLGKAGVAEQSVDFSKIGLSESAIESENTIKTPQPENPESMNHEKEALQQELEEWCLLSKSLSAKEVYKNIGKAEEKKFGVKSFINEVKAKHELCNLIVFRMIEKYTVVTARLLTTTSDISVEEAEASLEYLKNKGYLRECGIVGSGSFFCISPKGIKAFQAKDACAFLKAKRLAAREEEKSEITVYSVLTRMVYATILTDCLKRTEELNKIERSLISAASILGEEYFLARLQLGDTMKGPFFTGACWSEGKEIERYLSFLTKYKPEKEVPIIVGGVCAEEALCQASYLIEKLELDASDVYYYGITEEHFFSYTENQEIALGDILGVSANTDTTEIAETSQKDTAAPVEESGQRGTAAKPEETKQGDIVEPVDMTRHRKIIKPENTTRRIDKADIAELSDPAEEPVLLSNHDVMEQVYRMIAEGKIYCAVAYLCSLRSLRGLEVEEAYQKLAYALGEPGRRCSYDSQVIFTLYSGVTDCFSQYLMVSAALRNFFLNHISYDYDIKSLYAMVKELPPVSASASLTKTMYQLVVFKETVHKGIDFYADYRVKDQIAVEREMEALVSEAKSYYDSYVTGHIKENASNKRFLETRKAIFAQEGDFAVYLKTIVDRDEESAELVKTYLEEHFIKDNGSVEYSNVDDMKLNQFIDFYWEKAGETMRIARRTSDLMSRLRNNLLNAIEKVLQVMCEWIALVEKVIERKDDEGKRRYKEGKKELLAGLVSAKAELQAKHNGRTAEELAGMLVLEETLRELCARLDGSYEEWKQKYYYIDFLRGEYVLLTESPEGYLPDMRGQFMDFQELSLSRRILKHVQTPLVSFEKRLEDIFKNYGDDYGSAELIVRYLEDQEKAGTGTAYPELYEIKNNLKKSEEMAESEAKLELDDFIETLELAQSYGQIEETKENKKEKIQKIANEWFAYAKESKNYGFFKMVLQQYRRKIYEDAKVRGRALLQELEQIREQGNLEERIQRRIAKIQEMIENQNYTVAEDLLSKINSDETDETMELAGTDYLKSFIEDYDDNYKVVADSSRSLKGLISSRSHNKDDRGANRLIDNWMSNGQPLGVGRLGGLLDALGFAEAEIKEQPKIGKIENYSVLLKVPAGRKVNYKHPIAAFGSRASEEGFRVVCLFGRYDAERLIEEFKNIRGTKNTLVLLDYALQLPDRRKLARKVKSDLNDKVFAVLDRVLLMFLVNHYNTQFVNQILMSVMMPFSYYQPYVWDSSKIMPPEIFKGRKDELEKIESPAGVNIVYGGRQLGKSALLKMAKRNVDYDENQDRAVLVEIKGLNFERAARKIGHELYDAGVLEEDIDTTDWEELARAIKRRLQDGKLPQIPYLLLLMDEADTFIESCEAVNFQPFDALKDIQSVGIDRFKFVIAGLHNIVRFKRDAALSKNSVLTQLTSITVKPFDKREARLLLEEPLHSLGFRFPEEKQSLVSLILANTNYFPGLIQLYCANLIGAMRKEDYAGYDETNTPIYEIRESHIKKLLSDTEFMDQIREKFEITLKLDEDNLYYIIALLIANLYHQNTNSASESEGFSAKDIIQSGQEYAVKKIAEAEETVVNGLMQELVELNILRQTVTSRYLFSRYSFFQMMGTSAEVEEKLLEYMED